MSNTGFLQSAVTSVRGLLVKGPAGVTAATADDGDAAQRAQIQYRRGRARMRLGELAEAVTEFDSALALVPDYAEAVAARAEALDMLGQTDAARPEYARARALWAANRPGAPDRRYVFRRPGRFTFELESYELALQRIKTGSFPNLACGNALLVLGRPDEALKYYDKGLKLKVNDPDLTALRGEALSLMGQYQAAIDAFDFALAINPKDADSLSSRAIAYTALGRLDEANADWRRQLTLLGMEQPAARGCVALRLIDYAVAAIEFERALEKEPSDPYWQLYGLTAQRRLAMPLPEIDATSIDGKRDDAWPAPLLAFQAGRMSADEVLARADTDGRRMEALFQMGVAAVATDPRGAAKHWQEIVDRGAPALIEHAAARNELARTGA